MSFADQLTVTRAISVPVVIVLFAVSFSNHDYWATGVFCVAMAVGLLGIGAFAVVRQRRSITRYERTGQRDRWTDVGFQPPGVYGSMSPKRYRGPFMGDDRKTESED